MTIRPFRVLVHRYIGLATIAFSINTGLSGRLPAFYGEMQRTAGPQWHAAGNDRKPLDSLLSIENAVRITPHALLPWLWINQAAVQISVLAIENAQAGKLDEPDSDQLIPS